MHEVAVIVELVAFAGLRVLTIAMSQDAWKPAPVGKAGVSHCVAAGAVAAEATGATATPRTVTEARASPTAAAATNERRKIRDPIRPDFPWIDDRFVLGDAPDPFVGHAEFARAASGRKLRNPNDDNKADRTVGTPLGTPK
jgi:hypothetical protein